MAVNIKRGRREHMTDVCRERFHTHTVFQRHHRKDVPQRDFLPRHRCSSNLDMLGVRTGEKIRRLKLHKEWQRLCLLRCTLAPMRGMVEFLTTIHYVEKYLKQMIRIIKISAGTGRYYHYFAQNVGMTWMH